MPVKIRTPERLKKESKKGAQFFLLLNHRFKIAKWILWDDSKRLFFISSLIDHSAQALTEKQIMDQDITNIGLAMRIGAFFKDE